MNLCHIRVEPSKNKITVPFTKGLFFQKETAQFIVNLFIDLINQRVKVKNYQCTDYNAFTDYLEFIAIENNLTKIILVAPESDWQQLFLQGFSLEAIDSSYFQGKIGFHLSRFLSAERRISHFSAEEDEILKQAVKTSPNTKPFPPEYLIKTATPNETGQLINLFSTVFETYPTPLNDPSYLQQRISQGAIYKVIVHHEKIVSAATLETDESTKSAELTDCATLPEYQGQGLMSYLINDLEKDASQMGIVTVYTIARATSLGINKAFARHGYRYSGRFINNCDICGKFEDMNLWSKYLTAFHDRGLLC